MTLIVGLHLGSYVLIGADTREGRSSLGGLPVHDDAVKLHLTSIGLAAGAGLGNLVEAAIASLQRIDIDHPDRIVDVLNRESQQVRLVAQKHGATGEVFDALEATQVFVTYQGRGALRDYPGRHLSEVEIRLAVASPSPAFRLVQLRPFDAFFIGGGAAASRRDEWRASCVGGMKRRRFYQSIDHNIDHHVRMIARLIEEAARTDDTIGTTCVVGIHLVDGRFGLTSAIGQNGSYSWETMNRIDTTPLPDGGLYVLD